MIPASRTLPAAVCLMLAACAPPAGSVRAVTTVAELAAKPRGTGDVAVHLRGVVTYSERKFRLVFVQDDTGGVNVYHSRLSGDFHPGTAVEVSGTATVGSQAIVPASVAQSRIAIVGSPGMPAPRRVSLRDLGSGQCDGRWIETAGTVYGAGIWDGYLRLDLSALGDRLEVRILNFPLFDFNELVGTAVTVKASASIRRRTKRVSRTGDYTRRASRM